MDSISLYHYLEQLGSLITKPMKLTLIGSSINLLKKQDNRMTPDIDVYMPKSKFDLNELKKINKQLGIKLDLPGEDINENDEYIQLISPGIIEMGVFEEQHFMTFGNLEVYIPPSEFVVASKLRLVLDDNKHEADIQYLINVDNLTSEKILSAIDTFNFPDSEIAKENLVLFFYQKNKKLGPV